MPYRLEIVADNPAELANALTGLFHMPAILAAQTQQLQQRQPLNTPAQTPEPEAKAEPPKVKRGRPKKEQPTETVEQQLKDSMAQEPEADDPVDAEAPAITKEEVQAKAIGYANAVRTANPKDDTAAQKALAKIFSDMNVEPKISTLPADRYQEFADLIDAAQAGLG